MLSQSFVHFSCTCHGFLNLTFHPNLTVGLSKKAARVDHWTVDRQALRFRRPSSESPVCASLRPTSSGKFCYQQSVRARRKRSAKNRIIGGGSMLPHAAAAASELPVASAKSRFGNGDRVVIVDHGCRRAQSNAMLHEFVKMYEEETDHQLVAAAHMLATPTIADAVDRCVEQGATRIIICPYLFPGRHWDKDIPALAAEAAQKHPRVSYLVTAPIGLHKLMTTVIQDRMEHCLSQTAGEVSECDIRQLISPESQLATETFGSSVGTLTPTMFT